MKIIIPALPSDYAKPYPELVFEIPAATIRGVAWALRLYAGNYPLCNYIESSVLGDTEVITSTIKKALHPNHTIWEYLSLGPVSMRDWGFIQVTWARHIERSIWEQLGECQI